MQSGLAVSQRPTNLYEGNDYVVVKSVHVEKLTKSDQPSIKVGDKRKVKKNYQYLEDVKNLKKELAD